MQFYLLLRMLCVSIKLLSRADNVKTKSSEPERKEHAHLDMRLLNKLYNAVDKGNVIEKINNLS